MSIVRDGSPRSRSWIEEVIGVLWLIAAIISFGFHFYVLGWICGIKALSDMMVSCRYAWATAMDDIRRKRVERPLGFTKKIQ